ncbi:RNA polymerase sigma factor [Saccharothrix variisporea]|uniref:RNA polymerase sigma factor (Sigma-70 family) n=1 Tax=Saccharothrix variisporea TaxID=543527 RepID=A0A495XFA3_9PSEU|nr:sigma-70 family RNA polymerase sigma factor [Saccharothrix variisporea]RKT71906.1 RNA polymerase sigma factor (sigma-70 family) [Saccharothrix variisporea]
MCDLSNAALLASARLGDHAAWHELVRRHLRLVWAVARSFRLTRDDAADVAQATWLVLAENLTTIRHPERLTAWLVTTARRESLAVLRTRSREEPADLRPPDTAPSPEDTAEAADTGTRLWHAYRTLPARCRRLLHLIAHAPDLTYPELAQATGIPANSLGPTRHRCLAVLRRRLTAEAVR